MSLRLPAPLMIVVFSFSMTTFLARPSIAGVTVSSLMPRSSEISCPPVRIAMSSSIALRRSPKPGAFTAATLRPPRSLLTTRGAIASPSTSSETISSRLPPCPTASGRGGIAVRRDGADLRHFGGRTDLAGALLDVLDHRQHRDVDAALEIHRVHAGRDRLRALAHDRLREHGCGGGAVAREIVGLLRDFAHHLRAHVLELVFQFDFLRDRHAVLGDARRAEAFVEHHVAALRAERDLHGIGENIDAAQ